MSQEVAHTLRVQAKAGRFDVEELHNYSLSLQVGIRDLQLAVTDGATNSLMLLEDYALEGVTSVNTRMEAIARLYNDHTLLHAGFWANVKISTKTHKFTLVPQSIFAPEAMYDYLSVNCEIRSKSEEVKYYKHISTDAINVFAADKKMLEWMEQAYPQGKVQLVHQGSALIEGILRYNDHSHEKTMFCYMDMGILHLVVTLKQKVLYYNQFAVRDSQDYLKFIMLVFKELELQQKTTKVVVWGAIKQNSPQVELLRKYIRNISFGHRPTYLKTSFEFDEIPDHQYFDLLNIFLCE